MENLRGAALMTGSMLGFAIEDALIKSLSGTLPPGQIVMIIGAGGLLVLSIYLRATGQRVFVPGLMRPKVLLRTSFEALGTAFFVSSLALIDLTLASAVIQATPLVVAMGAALFLGQSVGWRRWAAIAVGFAGVLLIVKPGLANFEPLVILAVVGMIGLAARDIVTRSLNTPISGVHLSIAAFLILIPTGLALCAVWGQTLIWPNPREWAILALCIVIGMIAYLAIIAATRAGDAAFISSFRYARMVFALAIGAMFFSEIPDGLTIIGVAIVIGAGLFTLLREARLAAVQQHPSQRSGEAL